MKRPDFSRDTHIRELKNPLLVGAAIVGMLLDTNVVVSRGVRDIETLLTMFAEYDTNTRLIQMIIVENFPYLSGILWIVGSQVCFNSAVLASRPQPQNLPFTLVLDHVFAVGNRGEQPDLSLTVGKGWRRCLKVLNHLA